MQAPSFVRTFALANILAISTGSIMSANVFWQWTSMWPFNRSYIIVFVRYVLRRLKAGKLLSEVRDSYFFNNGGWSRIQQNWRQETQLIHQKLNQLKFCEVVFLNKTKLFIILPKWGSGGVGGWRAPQQTPPLPPPMLTFQIKGPSQLFSLNRCYHRVHRILLAKKILSRLLACVMWFNFFLGLIFICFSFIIIHYHTQTWKEKKLNLFINPRIKLYPLYIMIWGNNMT